MELGCQSKIAVITRGDTLIDWPNIEHMQNECEDYNFLVTKDKIIKLRISGKQWNDFLPKRTSLHLNCLNYCT